MVLPTLVALAPRFGIRAVRLTRDDLGLALRHDPRARMRKIAEAIVFRTLAAWAAPRLRAAGIAAPARVFGLHATGHVDEPYVLAVVARLEAGVSELYCHPVSDAPATSAGLPRGYESGAEVDALTSPRVRAALADAGVELVTYRALTM
jgi:predicted glycoside hydrolase/deacetylase ChbG (UPF0249 family)